MIETYIIIGVIGILLLGYFIPTFIASSVKANHTTAIFIFNLLLGFTVIGWIISLVWALADSRKIESEVK